MSNNRFVEHNISIRIGRTILKPEEINEENIIQEVENFNTSRAVEDLPDWLNHEVLDIDKVKSWFAMISSLDMDQFLHFKDRTIYLNHEAFQLTYTAPTQPASYNGQVKLDFVFAHSPLSRPNVDFGSGIRFNQEIYTRSKDYLYQVMEEVKGLEKKLNSDNLVENSQEHAELLDRLLIRKYARFCAIKAVKRNLEVHHTAQNDAATELQLEEVNAMYQDFMVPPMH